MKYPNEIELSKQYFEEKFHCSQAVFAAFAPQYGISKEQALKIGGCFGSGMYKGEVCGAVTGALMVIGLAYGQSDIDDLASRKKEANLACLFIEKFKEENGSFICKELLKYDLSKQEDIEKAKEKELFTRFCPKMVVSAATILKNIIANEEKI